MWNPFRSRTPVKPINPHLPKPEPTPEPAPQEGQCRASPDGKPFWEWYEGEKGWVREETQEEQRMRVIIREEIEEVLERHNLRENKYRML